MTRQSGVVLINALVVVLAIAAIAAALLTRSEAARFRAASAGISDQVALYLDGAERLPPRLLTEVTKNSIAHLAQNWATGQHNYPIDRGQVQLSLIDLQGRLNLNWLLRASDETRALFTQVFAAEGVSQGLVAVISDHIAANGPVTFLDQLRGIDGVSHDDFSRLERILSALPIEERLNLNTAPRSVLQAALAPLPTELVTETLNRETPIETVGELRRRAIELLETEEIDHLPFDRFTVGSVWFQARLSAELDGHRQSRVAIYHIDPTGDGTPKRIARWAVYD